MAVIDFPNSPTVGQEYTVNDRIWVWTANNTWDSVESEVVSGPTGPTGPAGPANTLTIGTVSSTGPDNDPGVSITGTAPVQELSFRLKQGPTGPPTSISIGTVSTGLPGTTAAASFTGPAGSQILSLTIPQGPTGPETSISIGTVSSTLPDGTPSVSITGPAGNQVLSFVLQQGPTGPIGPTGPTGPAGSLGSAVLNDFTDVTITGTPSDNSLLAYDTTSSQWINQTASQAGVAELSGASFTGNISTTGTISGTAATGTTTTASTGVGYMGIPASSGATTGAYELVAGDAGEHIYTTASRTVTIPANSSVAFPIGTTIVFISGAGATTTIAITSDTLLLAGTGTTGSRTLAAHGMATAVKVAATTWYISGNGLS